MEHFNPEEFRATLIRVYGSIKNAAAALGVHSTSLCPKKFQRLTDSTRLRIIQEVRKAEQLATQPQEASDSVPEQKSDLHPPSNPQEKGKEMEYDPGQEGVTFAGNIIRLTASVLLSFSLINDKDKRRAVRASIDPDLRLLLHAIHVHAAEYPGEAAALLKNRDILRQMGLTIETIELTSKKG